MKPRAHQLNYFLLYFFYFLFYTLVYILVKASARIISCVCGMEVCFIPPNGIALSCPLINPAVKISNNICSDLKTITIKYCLHLHQRRFYLFRKCRRRF